MSKYWRVDMKNIKYIISATVASVALMLSVALPKVVGATLIDNVNKVTICHRTNSVKNPYVKITVDASAVDGQGNNDHSHHTGPVATSEAVAQALKDNKTKWGDIIPSAADGGVGAGLNWDSVGQAVFSNGCLGGQEIKEVVPAAVTFTAPTCNTLGSYTIPTTENVQYLINGEVVAAGTYTAQNGTTVTVTAEATQGFFIGDETTDTWTNAFTAPTNCGEVLGATTTATTTTPPQVTAKPVGGVSAGAGGGSSTSTAAMVGLVGSIVTLGLGLSVRKWTT